MERQKHSTNCSSWAITFWCVRAFKRTHTHIKLIYSSKYFKLQHQSCRKLLVCVCAWWGWGVRKAPPHPPLKENCDKYPKYFIAMKVILDIMKDEISDGCCIVVLQLLTRVWRSTRLASTSRAIGANKNRRENQRKEMKRSETNPHHLHLSVNKIFKRIFINLSFIFTKYLLCLYILITKR